MLHAPVAQKARPRVRLVLLGLAAAWLGGCTVVSLESPGWPPSGLAPDGAVVGEPIGAGESVRPAGVVRASESWVGHYEGVQPCADCAGVRTLLTLNRDGSYMLSISYMGSNRLPTILRGNFTWNSDETEIILDEAGGSRRYMVGMGELRLLNRDGSPVRGLMGEHITLRQRRS